MRKALSLLSKAAISCLLLYFALGAINIAAVKSRLNNIDPRWIGFGLLLLLAQVLANGMRWRLIVTRCGANLPIAEAFRFSMIAAFFNQTLPTSVGGDGVRIWLLGKQTNWRVAAYSVFLDRVIGVVALALLVVVCLPWSLELVRNPVGRAALLLIGWGCIAAGLIFVGLAWRRLQILQRWSITRHLAAAATVALGILRSPRMLGATFGLSIAIHLLTSLVAWCGARAVGADMPLLYSLFVLPPVILVTIVPISIAGWGVREGAMIAAFGYAGLAQSDGLIVSLLFGASYLAIGVVGGLVWILTVDRKDRRILPAPIDI